MHIQRFCPPRFVSVLSGWTGRRSAGQRGFGPFRAWTRWGGESSSRSRNTWGGEPGRKRRRKGRRQGRREETRREEARRGNRASTVAGTLTSTTQCEETHDDFLLTQSMWSANLYLESESTLMPSGSLDYKQGLFLCIAVRDIVINKQQYTKLRSSK